MEEFRQIPTSQIISDIQETESEIDSFAEENNILMKNPQRNKLAIYMNEGRILQRQSFIKKLQSILDFRQSQTIKQ